MKDTLIEMVLASQENEATEEMVYAGLSNSVKDPAAKKVLKKISKEEGAHYRFFKKLSGREIPRNKRKIFKYYWLSRIFGLTFGLRLMENGEAASQANYKELAKDIAGLSKIIRDEERHEHALIDMLNEERLEYISSVVLGLSDAIVEFTGMLAGFTLAMGNSKLIALSGLIAGVAAAMSMAASQYLAIRSDPNNDSNPVKSAIYTGSTYIFTVILLVSPYLMLTNYFHALLLTLLFAMVEILIFNYYISVAKRLSFLSRFAEMAVISLTVAAISFGIGYLVKIFLGVNV